LHKLSYGLYVVTSRKGDKLNGQIANTVFQITSEPPTIGISINRKNLTWEYIKDSGIFAVAVLCQDTPLPFIGRFGFRSGRDTDKMEGLQIKLGQTGAPIVLDNATAYLEARVVNQLDVGTHTIFVGEVVDAEVLTEKVCMTYDYYQQVKRGMTPKTAPSYVAEVKEKPASLLKRKCLVCGWMYDPAAGDRAGGIAPGAPFDRLPDSWKCPVCGASKSDFVQER
jgi:flavin reductase (DIM6/NTAB) family NADH-FMN oxidoreductase RutF/rubredoxin